MEEKVSLSTREARFSRLSRAALTSPIQLSPNVMQTVENSSRNSGYLLITIFPIWNDVLDTLDGCVGSRVRMFVRLWEIETKDVQRVQQHSIWDSFL